MSFIRSIALVVALALAPMTRAQRDGGVQPERPPLYTTLLEVKEPKEAEPLLTQWFQQRICKFGDSREDRELKETAVAFTREGEPMTRISRMFVSTKDDYRRELVDAMWHVDSRQRQLSPDKGR